LEENIEAILNQSYSRYRTILVTDSVDDPAYSIASTVLSRYPTKNASLYTAEPHPQASGKVAALLTGLERDRWASEAYAFVDSDALTSEHWLRDIIDPLKDQSVGATTGFRWYIPAKGGFWSNVQSAWNAAGTNVMFSERYNFPWGGAMALLKETLKEINIHAIWESAISDDLSLNQSLRDHGYRVAFIPQCTVITYNQTCTRSFVEWAIRQVAITRVFNPQLWDYGLAAYSSFTVLSILAVVSLFAGIVWSAIWLVPAVLLFTPSILGILRSSRRLTTLKHALPEFASDFERSRWAHAIASLIVPCIMTYCIIKSTRTNQVEWRGRKYKLTGQTGFA
jgi:ceramide glucosyltransferase